MDLDSLLRPGADARKPIPYLLAYSFVGASGFIVLGLHYGDYLWAFSVAVLATYTPFVLLGTAHAVHLGFGKRIGTPLALGLSVVGGALLAQLICIPLNEHVFGFGAYPGKGFLYKMGTARGPILWWGLGAAAWYVMRRADFHAAQLAREQVAGEELSASLAELRLRSLQAQVEPHFLFNTLAHVKWLYRRDPAQGRRMLERLLDYLKAALPRLRQTSTPLEQELELARAYLDIQQLRIGDRLEFTIEVPAEIASLRFPPLMLLTLVENAIKHGIAPQPGGGSIGIRARADERLVRIEVRDTGAGLRQASGSGIGLANVRARLSALFGAGARLVIEPNVPRGVVAAIEIPR